MKSYYILLSIVSICSTINLHSQNQMGSDITGNASNQALHEVALNADGSKVMVGSKGLNGEGKTQVYEFDGTSWNQIGQDIHGEFDGDGVFNAFAMNNDGTIIAIGAKRNDGVGTNSGHVRVFELSNNTWTQLGSEINGEHLDQLGTSIALNSTGTVLAVGAPYRDDEGQVQIYAYDNNNWTQLGNPIDGIDVADRCGTSVAMNLTGSRIAIGSIFGDDNGHVRVFELINNTWIQIGMTIIGEADGDQFGRSIAMSDDGTIVAAGAWFNDGNGPSAGHVRVYKLINTNWIQIGQDIDGDTTGDYFGRQIALSGDGNVLVVGAMEHDGGGEGSGMTRVFETDGLNWNQVGSDIYGAAPSDFEGLSVAISRSGQVIGTGSSGHDSDGLDFNGRVRVFNISALLNVEELSQNEILFYPNPVNNYLSISGKNAEIQVTVFNLSGQIILKNQISNQLDLSRLDSGIYIIILTDGNHKSTYKVIKQ